MNNKHIQDLTLRLSQALDQNYDVVNMDAVLSVISALEGTTITKEQLEATRLAKYINQLRRRTKSEQLARRAKSLLKKWREMVGIQQQTQSQMTAATTSGNSATTTTAIITPSNNTSFHEPVDRNQQQQQQFQVLSQSTSTTSAVGSSRTFCLQSANRNNNPIHNSAASLTLSANLTSLNSSYRSGNVSNKISDLGSVPFGKTDGASATAADMKIPPEVIQQQQQQQQPPTSFASILSKLCRSDKNNKSSNTASMGAGGDAENSSVLSRDISPSFSQQQQQTLVISQSPSNSNEDFSSTYTKNEQQIDTIVIDIQDSNSVSSVIAQTTTAPTKTSSPYRFSSLVGTTNITPAPIAGRGATATPLSSSKAGSSSGSGNRKARKDQKRSREQRGELLSTIDEQSSLSLSNAPPITTSLVGIDETTLLQHHTHSSMKSGDDPTFRPLNDEKLAHTTSTTYPTICNISDILSLSNSSLSSIFPNDLLGADISKTIGDKLAHQQKVNNTAFSSGSNRTQKTSAAELTFAGKFKQRQKSIDFDYSNGGSRSTVSPYKTELHKQQSHSFMSFNDNCGATAGGGTFCGNSNDSASANSRISQFDVIDASASGNDVLNQTKSVLDNLQPIPIGSIGAIIAVPKSSSNQPLSTQATEVMDVTTVSRAITIVCEKVPKKRGRKKGSRGVDSVIAKEASLTSQMLISSLGSGGKKVKTTKELFAEMQNRKMTATAPPAGLASSATTASCKTLQQNQQPQSNCTPRPASSCSEPSLHSPRTLDAHTTTMGSTTTLGARFTIDPVNTVDLDSDSDTLTSGEPSRDSLVISGLREMQRLRRARGLSVDSNSSSQLPQQLRNSKQLKNRDEVLTATLEQQLKDLLNQLPSLPNMKKIEFDCTQELVPCSCKIIEILPKEQTLKHDEQQITDNSNLLLLELHPMQSQKETERNQENTIVELGAAEAVTLATTTIPEIQKPKKSIFDLDFDDDDDPLHKIVAEAAALKQNIEITEQHQKLHVSHDKDLLLAPEQLTLVTIKEQQSDKQSKHALSATSTTVTIAEQDSNKVAPQPTFPVYQVIEDPDCVAKQNFEIRTQQITEFHVNSLHNCYIPNVNGNWDDADAASGYVAVASSGWGIADEANGVEELCHWSDVVPKYGSLIRGERICKDLSHVPFTKKFKSKPDTFLIMDKWQNAPFLGVAYEHEQFGQKKRKNTVGITLRESQQRSRQYKNCSKVRPKQTTQSTRKHQGKRLKQEQGLDSYLIEMQETELKDTPGAIIASNYEANTVESTVVAVATDSILQSINNSTDLYKGITVDVHTESDYKVTNKNNDSLMAANDVILHTEGDSLHSSSNVGSNLLAILSVANSASDVIISPALHTQNVFSPLVNTTNPNSIVSPSSKDLVSAVSSNISSSESFKRTSKIDDVANTSSRRSSSCSNSSLKQAQQCINLKLKQHRILQQLLKQSPVHIEGSRKRKRQKDREKRRKNHESYVVERCIDPSKGSGGTKKLRLIKSLKIAMNGDVATQRQISLASSNNCNSTSNTDDDYDMEQPDGLSYKDIDAGGSNDSHYKETALKSFTTNGSDNDDEDDDEFPLQGKQRQFKNSCGVNAVMLSNYDDDNYHADVDNDEDVELNHGNCDELADYDEEDVDDDDEYDEEYNNTGDYHEVVTRDLSATTTTGNNHIVLTIKKTPSKTNSPTNSSLSAMSPVVVMTTGAAADTTNTTPIGTMATSMSNPCFSIFYNNDFDRVVTPATTTSLSTTTAGGPAKAQQHLATLSAIKSNQQSLTDIIARNTVVQRNGVSATTIDKSGCIVDTITVPMPPVLIEQLTSNRKKRRRLRRKVKPLKPFKFPNESISADHKTATSASNARDQKKHQQLFFPYELYRRTAAAIPGEKEHILNMSSCSSSCADEDTEYEFYSSSDSSTPDQSTENKIRKRSHSHTIYFDGFKSRHCQNDVDVTSSSSESAACSSYTAETDFGMRHNSIDIQTNKNIDNKFHTEIKTEVHHDITGHAAIPRMKEQVSNSAKQENIEEGPQMCLNKQTHLEYQNSAEDQLLSVENNGLLISFNNIYFTQSERKSLHMDTFSESEQHLQPAVLEDANPVASGGEDVHKLRQQLKLSPKNENCDVYNNQYSNNYNDNNNSNIDMIKYVSNSKTKQISNIQEHKQTIATTLIDNSNNNNNCKNPCKEIIVNDKDIMSHNNNININNCNSMNSNKSANSSIPAKKIDNQLQQEQTGKQQIQQLLLIPHKEYRTGLRAVDEDVADDDGNTCARIQKFKEWYEVLQLRSYNDELLTVLPYVVLE